MNMDQPKTEPTIDTHDTAPLPGSSAPRRLTAIKVALGVCALVGVSAATLTFTLSRSADSHASGHAVGTATTLPALEQCVDNADGSQTCTVHDVVSAPPEEPHHPFIDADDEAVACFDEARAQARSEGDYRAAFDCFSDDELLRAQATYLDQETEATADQVACVVARLEAMSGDEMREVMVSGIGRAAYVPCGLPD